MRGARTLRALGWLVRDTFRQALSSRILWLMLGLSALAIVFCLSIRIDGPRSLRPPGAIELFGGDNKPLAGENPLPGRMTLAFGAVSVNLFRGGEEQVHFLQVLLAKWVAGTIGTLLALIWTAGFLPEFLHPSAASVLLAKPLPRWCLLAGKYVGVLALVAFQTVLFVLGTWLAIGLRTHIWQPEYLWAIPLLLLHFSIIFSASAVLAVCTRSTVSCVFGSIVFWLICFGMNYGRHVTSIPEMMGKAAAPFPPAFHALVDAAYWVLPKPADLVVVLDGLLKGSSHFAASLDPTTLAASHAFHPALSILSSLLAAIALLGLAAHQWSTTDY